MNIKTGFALIALAAAGVALAEPPAPEKEKPGLDLKVGKVRHYMMPSEYQAALDAPDAEKSGVIVEGRRVSPEVRELSTQTMGLPALFWGLRNPSGIWRIFAPMTNLPKAGPLEKEEKVPRRYFGLGTPGGGS